MPEVRRLLQALALPAGERQRRLRWSRWRRAHQARARRGHLTRRAFPGPPAPDPPPLRAVAVPGTPPLDDPLWARLAPLLPPRPSSRGRPASPPRRLLGGIFWVARAGAPWREIPPGFGKWRTIYGRYRAWRLDGTWPQVVAILQQASTPAGPPAAT